MSGMTITYGAGECSSGEDKYTWRRATCQNEYENTSPDRRRIKYTSYNGKDQETLQVRTNPRDVANTVLKMAKKRANVNGTIEALAASELFTQDLEDLPEGMDIGNEGRQPSPNSKPDVRMPQESQQQGNSAGSQAEPSSSTPDSGEAPTDEERKARKLISEKQEKRLYMLCKTANLDIGDVKLWIKLQYKKNHLHEITWVNKEYDVICERIETKGAEIAKFAAGVKAKATQKAEPAVTTPGEMSEKDKLLSQLMDIAASKGKESEVDNICLVEFNAPPTNMTETMLVKAIELFKSM
jgi:hypothetical protein